MTDNELKPCPFCGGEPQLDECFDDGKKRYTIFCKDCWVQMRDWQVFDDKVK
jgi:transcription elongation factor Elf1